MYACVFMVLYIHVYVCILYSGDLCLMDIKYLLLLSFVFRTYILLTSCLHVLHIM